MLWRVSIRGRAALIAATVAASLALPGAAVANHADCGTPGAPACPVMNPGMLAGVQNPFVGSPTGVTLRVNQGWHESPAMSLEYRIAKCSTQRLAEGICDPREGFRFAFEELDAGNRAPASGTPSSAASPANCNGWIPSVPGGAPAVDDPNSIVDGTSHTDNQASSIPKAENLAGGVGMTVRSDYANEQDGAANGGQSTPVLYGYRATQPNEESGSGTIAVRPSLSFRHWDASTQTAHLCQYLYTTASIMNRFNDRFTHSSYPDEIAREFIFPVTIQSVSSWTADPEIGPHWSVKVDLGQFYNDLTIWDDRAMISSFHLYLEGITGGNWNRNPVTGAPERLNIGYAPDRAGSYPIKGVFTGCRNGYNVTGYTFAPDGSTTANNRVYPASFTDLCVGGPGSTITAVRTSVVDITPPPIGAPHDYGRLQPVVNGVTIGSSSTQLVNGSNTATLQWKQPNTTETIKAYALAVAKPGDTGNVHKRYIVVDPSHPDFSATGPCGASGVSPLCTLDLTFPLSSTGAQLDADDKYDVALMTVYADGHRSDGLCDDGTVDGAACDPELNDFRTVDPLGKSFGQFAITSKAWPHVYGVTTGSRDRGTVPQWLLFADFDTQEASLWRYRFNNTVTEKFEGRSSGIQGDNAQGGTIVYGDPPALHTGRAFNVVGGIRGNAVLTLQEREDNRPIGTLTGLTILQMSRVG